MPDCADQGRRCLQPVAGHSLQHLRLQLPDARPVPAVTATHRRPVVPVHAADSRNGAPSRYGEPSYAVDEEPSTPEIARLDEYFDKEHTLLTPREKIVLTRRFHLNDEAPRTETLEQVGRDLGLSKERVRQVQMSALGKLRSVLLPGEAMS